MSIRYAREEHLTASEYIACVGRTKLGGSRPLRNSERVQAMLDQSPLIVTARDETGELLGLCRCITDWHWVAYCVDLAVVEDRQGAGIGKTLLDEAAEILGPKVGIALFSLPGAEGFYRRIGMSEPAGFWRARSDRE